MPATYLRINITAHRPGSLPGYDGDRRVEWSIAEDAVSFAEAQRRTRDALRVLRAFWEEGAPEGLRFLEFAKTVLADGNGNMAATKRTAEQTAPTPAPGAPAEVTSSSSAPTQPAVDLVDPLAEKLVRHPNVLPAFLSDLRDWDSFRLLLRRHGGDVPFVTAASSEAAAAAAEKAERSSTAASNSPDASSDVVDAPSPSIESSQQSAAASVLLSAFTTREQLWQEERSSLHAALWAAGEQVRTLVATLTDTLEKVATLTANTNNGGSPATPSRKSVRWDELVLKREVIRETASHWGLDASDGNILEWREAEWLKELARQEELVRSRGGAAQGADGNSFSFSPEDILAVVRATRRLAGRVGDGDTLQTKDVYTSGSEEDDDTEEDTDDEDHTRQPSASEGHTDEASPTANEHDDDTESEDETDASVIAARLERLRELADLAVANSAKSMDAGRPSSIASAASATPSADLLKISPPTLLVAPASAPLPPISEVDGEFVSETVSQSRQALNADVRQSRAALDEDRPQIIDNPTDDRNVVLIASGRRRRSRPQAELSVDTGSASTSASSNESKIEAIIEAPSVDTVTPDIAPAAEPEHSTPAPVASESSTNEIESAPTSSRTKVEDSVEEQSAVEPTPLSTPRRRSDSPTLTAVEEPASSVPIPVEDANVPTADHTASAESASKPSVSKSSLDSDQSKATSGPTPTHDSGKAISEESAVRPVAAAPKQMNTGSNPPLNKKRSGSVVQRVWRKVSSEFRKAK
ncbi:hypothetical protein PhCBS80983_g02714 [Powellomyces hirtus]|uniref:Uncharacterized protein n=1 Tax=Powellomyces hirtus TaxID=109895 RepID=A0A507E7J6_9FUNG|nr:hypothetical protein PhCBS80983_g02714 [Powellomyces hirtus]